MAIILDRSVIIHAQVYTFERGRSLDEPPFPAPKLERKSALAYPQQQSAHR
ncbi:hypothetical protein GCM10007359_01970 [Rothia aerolata]|uniref:Uncharacterized protein n=1 Tax=Rothia aerolata TaxID=1812262 RepID=A0A917MQ33_9MICC|nr:hypothetical protein GCM10007359_01970 [Rothia aerolata]